MSRRDIPAAQHSCAGVPEIMHADYFQVIPLEKFLKVTGNIIIWLEQRSHVIDKHEIQIVCII